MAMSNRHALVVADANLKSFGVSGPGTNLIQVDRSGDAEIHISPV